MAVTIRSYAKEREKEIMEGLESAMRIASLVVENQAKVNVNQAPPNHPQVQNDELRSNIGHEVIRSGATIKGRIGTSPKFGKYVKHGAALEFGHPQTPGQYVAAIGKRLKASYVPAYPWLFPALEVSKSKIKELLKGAKRVSTG